MSKEKIIVTIEAEEIAELIPGYLTNRRKDLDLLREAVLNQDFEAIQSIGHKMKGSGGSYGLERISEIGSQLELSAKALNLPAIEQEIFNLSDFIERVEIVGEWQE
jgi:HPt (histidine-containing phosphotransfer) domain-containing protein